jgi:hypothetical protein
MPADGDRGSRIPIPSADLLEKLKSYGIDDTFSQHNQPTDFTSFHVSAPNTTPASHPVVQAQMHSRPSRSTAPLMAPARVGHASDGSLQYSGSAPPRLREATQQELLECLRAWLHESQNKSFQSFSVYCEYKLRRSTAQASEWASPNQFQVVVAWLCLMQCAVSMPHYSGLLEALAQNLGGSVFTDYEDLVARLDGDGCEDDAWLLFDAETHFSRSRRLEVRVEKLQTALADLMQASSRAKDELAARSMFSALGTVTEILRASIDGAGVVISGEGGDWNANNQGKDGEGDADLAGTAMSTTSNDDGAGAGPAGDATHLFQVAAITQMDSKTIRNLVTDIASHRDDFSTAPMLSNLFGSTLPRDRRDFVFTLWRMLHRTEKDVLLLSMPMHARDGGLRNTLESILAEHGMMPSSSSSFSSTSPNESNSKGSVPDRSLLGAIDQACRAAKRSGSTESKEFLFTMMCALGMVKVGEQNMSAATFELPRDPHGAIESRAREVTRLWHVAQDEAEGMREELETTHADLTDMKASIRSMSKIQARLNEYGQASGIRSSDAPRSKSGALEAAVVDGQRNMAEWPILHHTNLPRCHSLKRLVDSYFEERMLRSNIAANSLHSQDLMSVEELRSEIVAVYDQALLLGTRNTYALSQIIKFHMISEYSDERLAIEHCRRIDYALQAYQQTDLRCHLFGVVCGSLHSCSFLNRPETTRFIATVLAHMMENQVMGDNNVTCVADLFGSTEIAMQADRAERVVRNVFGTTGSGDGMVRLFVVCVLCIFLWFPPPPPPPTYTQDCVLLHDSFKYLLARVHSL